MYEALGKVSVAPNVLTTIVRLTTLEHAGVHGLCAAPANLRGLLAWGASQEGVFVAVGDAGVEVEVHVAAMPSANLLQLGQSLQEDITRAVVEMLGMQVAGVDVYIDEVALMPENTRTVSAP